MDGRWLEFIRIKKAADKLPEARGRLQIRNGAAIGHAPFARKARYAVRFANESPEALRANQQIFLILAGTGAGKTWDVAGETSEKVPTRRRRKWDKLRIF